MRQPYFNIFTGPMFGSKTTKMLAAIERASYQNKKVIAFKPKMDNRYAEGEIVTHTGIKFPAYNVRNGSEIKSLSRDCDVVAVDEAGNESIPSEIMVAQAQDECDFIECYPGDLKDGYCTAAPPALWWLAGLGILWRRRRGGRQS